jgi:hypothetical protein
MTDIESPLADIRAILDQFKDSTQMQIAAWLFASIVSPYATPKSILTQLGEECPGDNSLNHAANIAACADRFLEAADDMDRRAGELSRIPIRVRRVCAGSGAPRVEQGLRTPHPVDPSRSTRDDSEDGEVA